MGCSPSQAVIVQSTKTETSHLHPTIFMVADKSFQMLRELGELNFYHLAQYNEAEDTAESLHQDIAARLENPIQYLRDEQSKMSGNYHVSERSACKINADYTILVHRPGANAALNDDGLSKNESENSSSNQPCADSTDSQLTTASEPSSYSTGLLKSSDSPTHVKDIKITAENTSDSPILLSGQPSHLKQKDIRITETNESSSLTINKSEVFLSQSNRREESSPKFDATIFRTNCAPDPFDEIFSAPCNTGAATSAEQSGENIATRLKTKTVFGRNRVTPKGTDTKYNAPKNEHERSSSTSLDDS